MDYKRIIIIPDGELNDLTCDIALELGAVSSSIETVDPDAPWFQEIGEPFWENLPPAQLTCVLPKTLEVENFIELITQKSLWENIPTFRTEDIEDKDWSRVGRDDYNPIMITENLWIVPTWHESQHTDATNIRLDPGLAFGSGTHETTRLCLEWLAENIKGNESILDYGCGSGILSIAAKLVGAAMVHGTDIDPQAMQSAEMNAKLNRVDISLFEPDQLEDTYDIVIANILANPLKTLSDKISSLTHDSGRIVLSGIMVNQSIEIQKVYSSDFSFMPIIQHGDWVLIEGTKIQ